MPAEKSIGFVLKILRIWITSKNTPKEVFRKIHSTIKQVNKQLKKIAENADLSRIPTTNFARHTFSTVLKNAGVPVAMISEQLGHTSITTTQNYLSSFEDERLAEVSKHLTAFKNINKI